MFSEPTNLSTLDMNVEAFVDLAKNALNPIKCEWNAGTKVECNVLLNSWQLLHMHINIVHCQKIKNNYLCHLPRCNNSLQPSQPALIDHIESTHLQRAVFCCPLYDCGIGSLKGIDAVTKHYQDKHNDLDNKRISSISCKGSWKPVSWKKPFLNPLLNITYPTQPISLLPQKVIPPGTILAGNISFNWPQGLKAERSGSLVFVVEELGASQNSSIWEPEMSQQSQFISHGPSNMVGKRKKRTKQLEKAKEKEKRKEEEEEGIPKTHLDDLMGFPFISENSSDWVDDNILGFNGLARRWTGKGGSFLVGMVKDKEEEILMRNWVDKNVILGKRLDACEADLAKPEPMMSREMMLMLGGVGVADSGMSSYFGPWDDKFAGDWESARGPRSILFDVWQKRVDEIDRMREEEEVENVVGVAPSESF